MQNQKILHDSITDNFSWTNPIEIQGAFGNCSLYSFGSYNGILRPKRFKKVFKNISLPIEYFTKRQLELKQFEHENYVPVQFQNFKTRKTTKEELITEITLLSPYIESIPVLSFIKQKGELYISNFISIIQQMVNIMVFAQNKQIHHFHLNSSSLLLIERDNKNNSEFFLKVTDWGFKNEICSRKKTQKTSEFLKKICQSSMFQYLHPELLFEMENLQMYQKYKSKYDIWAFGIILYRLTFFRRPFENKGSFCPQKLEEYYKKKQNIKMQNPSLLTTLIEKMLSLTDFQTWAEIKSFLITKAQRIELDFLSIRQIFGKFFKLIEYMLEIYKLTAWSIHNSANCFWYENKPIMQKFLLYLLKLMLLLRLKFIQRFGHRILHLTQQEKKYIMQFFSHVESQFKRIQFIEPHHAVQKDFFDTLQKFIDYLTPLQTRINDFQSAKNQTDHSSMGIQLRQSWKSLKTLKEFSTKVISAKNRIRNCNRKIIENFLSILEQNL